MIAVARFALAVSSIATTVSGLMKNSHASASATEPGRQTSLQCEGLA